MSAPLRLYRPSNGSEGDWFCGQFCERCIHDKSIRDGTGTGCRIRFLTMMLDKKDEGYPREWCYDAAGNPTCTKFIEEGGPDDKPAPPPTDPRQIVLIADPTEIIAGLTPAPKEVELETVGVSSSRVG